MDDEGCPRFSDRPERSGGTDTLRQLRVQSRPHVEPRRRHQRQLQMLTGGLRSQPTMENSVQNLAPSHLQCEENGACHA